MKEKKSEVEISKPNSLKKAPSILNINGEKTEYIIFTEGNLPPHHHETVKEWLEKLITETLIFSEALQKKLKRMKQEKLFKEESFKLSDINHVLLQIYKTFDSSLENLNDFRKSIDDYISSWKVALDGNDLSDSSVEEVLRHDDESVGGKLNAEKEADIKSNTASHDETSRDSKDDKGSDKVLHIRVRKPSDINRPFTEKLSKDCNSRLSGMNGLQNKEHKVSSSSDECIICDDDNDDDVKKPEQASSQPVKKSPKVSLSVSKGKRKNVMSSDSDSQHSKLESVGTEVADKASGTETAGAQGPSEAKEVPKDELGGVDYANSSSDDCVLLSPGEVNKSKSAKEEEEKTRNVTKGTINWDTSSSESTEREWVVWNKKSKQEKDDRDKKKKKILTKKERQKNKKNLLESSDDDDNVSKLCDLKNLKRKKRNVSDSSSGSDEVEKAKKKKSSNKTNKKKEDKLSLMDCINESGSNHSDSSSIDLNLECISNLKCLTSGQEGLNQEEFSVDLLETDDLAVLTDSSFDSIVDALVKKNVKVKRGHSKSKKEGEKKTKVLKRRRDKLLEAKLTDTDTTEGEERYQKSKMKTRIDSSESEEDEVKPLPPKNKQRTTKNSAKARKTLFSDSEASLSGSESSNDKDKSEEDEDKDKKDDDSETEKKTENKKKRKRIQRHSDSSDEDGDPNTPSKSDGKGRRNIRKVLKEESLEKTTKEALKEEEERKRRIAEKQKLYNALLNKVTSEDVTKILDELVLDFDVETKEPLVSVDKDLVKKLKPHQAQGIKFMWDSCFESVKDAKEGRGSGCILAHCMGLGKTLQVVTLVHTLLTSDKVDVNRVLVVCPFSTVQNWVNEFRKWLKDVGSGEDIEVYNMIKTAVNHRSYQLRDWERTGGVMVLGYNLFRTLVAPKSRMKASVKKAIEETLLDPGPDVVVCDEGHILKNEKTAIAKAMSKLKTRRRIVLTGTPLQNNLVEYHCMVQFVKPNLLGTRKEFQNRFVHPIQNGQFEDSTPHDVKIMKRRAHVLHKMLDGIVQRKDYNVLTPYLPPKYEYVIHVKLTEVQTKLYTHYLENFARKSKNEGGGLFQDFQHLLRICTHPRSLLIHSDKESLKRDFEDEDSEGSLKDFIDDGSDSSESSMSESSDGSKGSGSDRSRSKTPPKRKNTRSTRASGNVSEEEEELPAKRTEWWASMVTDEELQDIKSSSKLFLFFTILKHCEEIGDKLLVFSQSLYTLDLIEHFLELVDENAHKKEEDQNPLLSEFNSNWDKGLDYFRLDGGTTSDCRANWCKVFNQASNTRGRLFLISTRAGGLGINLTGANRVIIFDASWNPSFDVQSIFRVYRFGQEKPCYIYRFLSKGTMEEKIYERQVAKLSTSLRVIDEQQIDRHFTQTSLAELYAFNPEPPETRETPILPKDRLMAELIQSYSDIILNHHQHDSLLENQEDEELNEEERKAAWLEFENEKNNVPPPNAFANQGYSAGFMNPNQFALQANMILNNLVDKVRLQNPALSEELIRKRAIDVLQASPFWQQHQQNLVNNYVAQQQQQFFQQQQFLQQQQMLQAQQLHQQQLKQQGLNTYPNLSTLLGERNGTSTSKGPGSSAGAVAGNSVGAVAGNSVGAVAGKTVGAVAGKSVGVVAGKSAGGPSQPIEIDDE